MDFIGMMICQAIYEPLYVRDIKTEKWILKNAEKCIISEDKLTATFILRQDRYWSDGSSITAQNYVEAFYRIHKSRESCPIYDLLYGIKNWSEVEEHSLPVNLIGVTAEEKYKLKIEFDYEIPYFKYIMGSIYTAPCYSGNKELISSGPYVLKEYRNSKDLIILRKNPHYDSTNGVINCIKFHVVKDMDVSLVDYKFGQAHITCNTQFPYPRINEFKRFKDFIAIDNFNLHYIIRFSDKINSLDLKKDLLDSIPKNEMAQKLFKGISPTDSFSGVNYQMGTRPNVSLHRYNHERIRMLYSDYYPNRIVAELLNQYWENTLGLAVILQQVDLEQLIGKLSPSQYDLVLDIIMYPCNDPLAIYLKYLPLVSDAHINQYIDCIENMNSDPEEYRFKCEKILF